MLNQKTLALALALHFPLLALADTAAPAAAVSGDKQLVIKVKEMNCQLCAYLVNKELRNIDGVKSTKASIQTGQVKVLAAVHVPESAMIQAIEKLHYSAEVLKTPE